MSEPKNNKDAVKKSAADVSSAPELTEEDKQRIESEMAVKSVGSMQSEQEDLGKSSKIDAHDNEDGADIDNFKIKDFTDGDESDPTDATGEAMENDSSSDTTDETNDGDSNAAGANDRDRTDVASADKAAPNDATTPGLDDGSKSHGHRIRRFFAGYWRHKKWSLPLTVLIILVVLAAVPYTRFYLAGLVIKRQATITVIDSGTKKPISSATVAIDGKSFKTDKDGKVADHRIKPGKHTLKASKKYYKDGSASLPVPIFKDVQQQITIEAIGRQVPVTVINKVTKAPLEDVTLRAVGVEVKTDKDGKAIMVLPADKTELEVAVSKDGFNELVAKIKITETVVPENAFALVPSGKLYFLSRQSGKIDVVKTDLDGSNRQTVIFGTGKEDDQNTILLASRDWKYLALLSRRDSSQSKLYIIDTSNDKLTLMDDSDAVFTLAGWSDHDFAYSIQRNNVKEGEANRQAVKKYNADKTQLLTVDQSAAEKISPTTMATQFFSSFYLVDKELTYVVTWQTYVDSYPPAALTDHPSILQVVLMSDGSKKDIKIPDDNVPLITHLYAPSELYIATYSKTANKNVYYEYEDGKVSAANNLDDNKFYGEAYSTYLASPDGTKTFWSEQRDGKDTFFVGDAEGKNGKQIGVWDEYQVYGWYGNSYLLVSKGGSELFIVPVSGGDPLKISDYHKPVVSYQGYGGGYGGL